MVEAIIENDALILLELLDFITNSHSSTLYSNKRKMYSQFFAGGAVVRRNVRTRSKSTEECMIVVSWHYFLNDFNRLWNLRTVLFEFDIVKEEIENVPSSLIVSK